MISFPPHRTKASSIISQDVALTHLTAYLTSSETQPHLLPNAHLDPSIGPTIRSSNFSVTIHNLRRVQAGLRGEILAPALDLDDASCLPLVSRNVTEVRETIEEPRSSAKTTLFEIEEAQGFNRDSNPEQNIISSPETNKLDQVKEENSRSSWTHIDKEARKRDKKLRRKELKKKTQRIATGV